MNLPKRYDPQCVEPALEAFWREAGVYKFHPDVTQPVYTIDTPPPTVSGQLHMGHVYSYSHADFIARFRRMKGYNVFYPMGFDDNGLPTERMVERIIGKAAREMDRRAFIERCLETSTQVAAEYRQLWQQLGLSIDWRYTYRTIDDYSRRVSQFSFIDLFRKGLVYRQEAPSVWCPECRTAIAQADMEDRERKTEFLTLDFRLEDGSSLPIATTRPELLPACVAIFVHPADARYQSLNGRNAIVPIFGQIVPVLTDPGADPKKGTGAVMCCTFGDSTDVAWWRAHRLPLIELVGEDGRLTHAGGAFAGKTTTEARKLIYAALLERGLVLNRQPLSQSVRVHERCDTVVEYLITQQWFIRLLEYKDQWLAAGEAVNWVPAYMGNRYRTWVENLNWDWCISRQRFYGVPFPVWYCQDCGEVVLADETWLPVDPTQSDPGKPCPACAGDRFSPEMDVMDTWATSSMSPQITGRWLDDAVNTQAVTGSSDRQKPLRLFERVFPYTLRPQGHEIIRTWAFYTIVKSHFHLGQVPWKNAAISGWGIAGEGMGKISKSKGAETVSPSQMITRYSVDAVRYWAASAGPGKDIMINEAKIQAGQRLIIKLWNVARFSEKFIVGRGADMSHFSGDSLSPADRWILSRVQKLIRHATVHFEAYDCAAAKSEVESFFWNELADNYLEMCKQRLYNTQDPQRPGAQYALYHTLLVVLKLLSPVLPYITEEIFRHLYAATECCSSIHISSWPESNADWEDDQAEEIGRLLVDIATAVRRFKSERSLSLGSEISRLQLAIVNRNLSANHPPGLALLHKASPDLASITRARQIELVSRCDETLPKLPVNELLVAAILI